MLITSKLLFKVFGNKPISEQFDKHCKSLKVVKSNENRESYKDCIAHLEIKLICTEDNLKKKITEIGTTKFKKTATHWFFSLTTKETIAKWAT